MIWVPGRELVEVEVQSNVGWERDRSDSDALSFDVQLVDDVGNELLDEIKVGKFDASWWVDDEDDVCWVRTDLGTYNGLQLITDILKFL